MQPGNLLELFVPVRLAPREQVRRPAPRIEDPLSPPAFSWMLAYDQVELPAGAGDGSAGGGGVFGLGDAAGAAAGALRGVAVLDAAEGPSARSFHLSS